MKKIYVSLIFLMCIVFLMGCSSSTDDIVTTEQKNQQKLTVIGFSQLGAESDWRKSNTESVISTFTEENGYKLIIKDGQQKQSNQIMAIRTFIQQGVDYILLAPVTETGWDTVLTEAKEAGIPVILVDRMVDVSDESLFNCWVGSNFELEGIKACEWLKQYLDAKNISSDNIHIGHIQGNIGASAQIGRTKALNDAVLTNGWDLLESTSGDFTQTKGREVMKDYLKNYDNINVVYCENDNMALGAIEAIENAGKKVGMDIEAGEIMIISFDGVNKDALENVLSKKIACIAECNPLHGPRVENIITILKSGKEPDKYSYVEGAIYSADTTLKSITVVGMECYIKIPELE